MAGGLRCRTSRIALALIGVGVALCGCAAVLVWRDHQTAAAYGNLADASSITASASAGKSDSTDQKKDKKSNGRKIDWDALRKQNPDVAAWVQVDGTDVDLPVVAPADKDMYRYLKQDFWGNWSISGCPFLDDRSSAVGPHSMSFGHHMGNIGGMYSDIFQCFHQEEFDRLGTCRWYTPDGGCEKLEPLFAMSVGQSYPEIQRFSFANQKDMQGWLEQLVEQSDAHAKKAKEACAHVGHVVTLVTCSSIWANQPYRTLVVFGDRVATKG